MGIEDIVGKNANDNEPNGNEPHVRTIELPAGMSFEESLENAIGVGSRIIPELHSIIETATSNIPNAEEHEPVKTTRVHVLTLVSKFENLRRLQKAYLKNPGKPGIVAETSDGMEALVHAINDALESMHKLTAYIASHE